MAARANEEGLAKQARLARLLAGRSDTMILLSATPHDGSARSFASLMSLLDPTAANQQAEQFKKSRREQRTQHIRKVFDEYREWVHDTMTTEPFRLRLC